MQRKKMIGLSLAALMIASSPVFAVENGGIAADAKVVPITAKALAEEKLDVVVAKEDTSVSPLIKINLKIPKVQGLQDVLYQEKLNKTILDKAMKEVGEMEAQAKEAAAEAEKTGWTFRPYELDISYEVKSKGDILSFTVTTYAYRGGANGMPWMDCYNIDTKQNREIELRELFKEGMDYETLLNQEVISKIEEHKKKFEYVYYFEGDMGFKTIADRQGYYLENGKLVLSFSKYSIAPGAAGMPEFEIPLYVLGPALKNTQPLIAEGTYYNYTYDFRFKIPPLWKDKVTVRESYQVDGTNVKVDFLYTPQGKETGKKLLTLWVVDSDGYKEPEVSNTYKIANSAMYIYLASLPQPGSPEAENGEEYRRFMAALDGIDDLFKETHVKQELEAAALNHLMVNGNKLVLQKPIYLLKNGTVMIPLRQVAEALGYTVTWEAGEQRIRISKGEQWTAVRIGENNYQLDEQRIYLGAAPELTDSQTYIPLEFMSRILKAGVTTGETGVISFAQ